MTREPSGFISIPSTQDLSQGWVVPKRNRTCQERGLNTRPPELQSVALPAELSRHDVLHVAKYHGARPCKAGTLRSTTDGVQLSDTRTMWPTSGRERDRDGGLPPPERRRRRARDVAERQGPGVTSQWSVLAGSVVCDSLRWSLTATRSPAQLCTRWISCTTPSSPQHNDSSC